MLQRNVKAIGDIFSETLPNTRVDSSDQVTLFSFYSLETCAGWKTLHQTLTRTPEIENVEGNEDDGM